MSFLADTQLLSWVLIQKNIIIPNIYLEKKHTYIHHHQNEFSFWGFPGGTSGKKNLPAMQDTQEMWAPFLGWEGSLEKEMATHSSILAWKIPRIEEPWNRKVRHNWAHTTTIYTYIHIHIYVIFCIFYTLLYKIYTIYIYINICNFLLIWCPGTFCVGAYSEQMEIYIKLSP